jgi:ubiquinone/menaquinone biosynthesis C-methylase UbiE
MVSPLCLDGYKRAVAEHFDGRTDYSRSEIHRRLADRLIRLAAPQRNERVLDVATGTGFVAIEVAHLVGEHGRVVGVDISPGMLAQAAKAVAAASLGNVELVRADAEALDYPPASFDLVICCNALPYMTNGCCRSLYSAAIGQNNPRRVCRTRPLLFPVPLRPGNSSSPQIAWR